MTEAKKEQSHPYELTYKIPYKARGASYGWICDTVTIRVEGDKDPNVVALNHLRTLTLTPSPEWIIKIVPLRVRK